MEKIYIVEILTNGECELPISRIEHIFSDSTKAEEWLKNKKQEVANKTSYHFKDKEWGWLNPILDEEYSNTQIHIMKAVTYKWVDTLSGKPMFTHFKILEYNVE